MSRQIKKKTSAILMASLLAMSSIPMSSSLSVYAIDYIGVGNSSTTGGSKRQEHGLGSSDYGIRIYAIDKDGNIKT